MKLEEFESFWKANISDLTELLKELKKAIGDEYRASCDPEDTLPAMQITISINENFSDWSYQTGDNSYSGSCYHHPFWGVGTIHRKSNSPELAKELIEDLSNQINFE
jgi:hypothetical protein